MRFRRKEREPSPPPHPGISTALDGRGAAVALEAAVSASAGTGAPEWTPQRWNAAAAGTAAGRALVGRRGAGVTGGREILATHDALHSIAGKHLAMVLHLAATVAPKHAISVHAGHDGYHGVDDAGLFQLFASDVQEVADLTIIAHRVAELALIPGLLAQDVLLTTHSLESVRLPDAALIRRYLGAVEDLVDSPTPAQRLVFGPRRRRIPELFDLDYPTMLGGLERRDAYQQGVAAQRPFFLEHVPGLVDAAFREWGSLTGRSYARASGHLTDDADLVIVAQGSAVATARAVAGYLRAARRLDVGVVGVTMFRPFPADEITAHLRGKRAAVVLDRVDQPLAVDPPLLREIRAAFSQAVERGRAGVREEQTAPPACRADDVPAFFSALGGLGGHEPRPGDLIEALERVAGGKAPRSFYLGIDFVRRHTRLPKLQIWQERLLDEYPDLGAGAINAATGPDVRPAGAFSVRLHAVGGQGCRTAGRALAIAAATLTGSEFKAVPGSAGARPGRPVTFELTLAGAAGEVPARSDHVDAVLFLHPGLVDHHDPLRGLRADGLIVIASAVEPQRRWETMSPATRRAIRSRGARLSFVDGLGIARAVAGTRNPERVASAAVLGAFFGAAPLTGRTGVAEEALLEPLRAALQAVLPGIEARDLEANLEAARRGLAEAREVALDRLVDPSEEAAPGPPTPERPADCHAQPGIGQPGRFWEQVGYLHRSGAEGIADPFAALGAVPAATPSIRDLADLRQAAPAIDASRCTGCGACWLQCPEMAMPAVVGEVETTLRAGLAVAGDGRPLDRVAQVIPHLAREIGRLLRAPSAPEFSAALSEAYGAVVAKLKLPAERRRDLDLDFGLLWAVLEGVPLVKTARYFDEPEGRQRGSGGLLAIGVDPQACTGCRLCAAVCPEDAIETVAEDEGVREQLERRWALSRALPDTSPRFVAEPSELGGPEQSASLLLRRATYFSMLGGDGVCPGCGERTVLHLVFSAIHAVMGPRVQAYLARLDELIAGLEARARGLLTSDIDLAALRDDRDGELEIPLEPDKRATLAALTRALAAVEALRERYFRGPGGRGRAACAVANSFAADSVRGSVYPCNPYPFPWVTHLDQSPAVARGIFEGQFAKLCGGFAAVRRAEELLADGPATGAEVPTLDWRELTAEEWGMCPPVLAVTDDEVLRGAGLHGLHELLGAGVPVRVVLVDRHVHGIAEPVGARVDPLLLGIAHRDVFVLQSSQATPEHLLAGVVAGLDSAHPALFVLDAPCPSQHGFPTDGAVEVARAALECRIPPRAVYDPARGPAVADRLSLDGNPAPDEPWTLGDIAGVHAEGGSPAAEGARTAAHWAQVQGRFGRFFTPLPEHPDGNPMPLDEYLGLPREGRGESVPFVLGPEEDAGPVRLQVAEEIVQLAGERLQAWTMLRELSGDALAPAVRAALTAEVEARHARDTDALRAEHERALQALRQDAERRVAGRMARGLLRAAGDGRQTVAELLAAMRVTPAEAVAAADAEQPPAPPAPETAPGASAEAQAEEAGAGEAGAAPSGAPAEAQAGEADAGVPAEAEDEELLVMEPYIETLRCTTCNECTDLNAKMFAYDENKQAYIQDARAGPFKDLVVAAQKCPVAIIHPGTPLDPDEKGLDKWIALAEEFN